MYTNKGLVKHAEAALKLNTKYMWGGILRPITNNYIDQLADLYKKTSQYPESRIQTLRGLVGKNYFGCDCVGLIKSYYWSGKENGGTGSPNYGKAGFPDVNAHGMYNAAKVKEKIDTIPEVPGLVVYCKSRPHVGVYVGNGYTIESTLGGGFDGIVKRKLKDWIWEYWFPCPYITYEETATESTTAIATEKKCVLAYPAVVRAAPKASSAQLGRYNPGMTVTILPGSETRDEKSGFVYVKIKKSAGEAWIVKSAIKS